MAGRLTESLPMRYASSSDVLRRIEAGGLPHGREQSFKLARGRLLPDRLLVGLPRGALDAPEIEAWAMQLGMPEGGWELLAGHLAAANAVFIGTEDGPTSCMLKMYLEFWDDVRQAVRNGARTPQLLHLGVKWSTDRPARWEEARYLCHPLLSTRDILRRMAGCYAESTTTASLEHARAVVQRAAQRAPGASFLYLEVEEAGNPRRSYDINLYKSGLRVRDAADNIRAIASHLGVPGADVEGQLDELGERPLGHISGGTDRRGEEFLSVYAEIQPLPDDA